MKALLVFLSVMGVAHAGEKLPTLPPVEYDRPYLGKLTIKEVPALQTDKLCREITYTTNFKGYIQACTFFDDTNKCIIIMPEKTNTVYSEKYMEYLRRHEIGHCNGWGPEHPRGR